MKEEKITKVFVSGCTGRMGKLVVEAVNQHLGWKVCGGLGLGEHQYDFPVFSGSIFDASNFWFSMLPTKPQSPADIIIDFSTSVLTEFVYQSFACLYGIPMVCATTKLPKELIKDMKSQEKIPIFQAYNMAYDVYVFTKTVVNLVKKLPDCDIDVREIHHIGKRDAPSGTALNLAHAINRALGETHTIVFNPSTRNPNEIHIHSERRGSYAGTHIVTLTSANNYTITLAHEAFSPQIFVEGAIKATEFLLTKPIGYYNMDNL